jgi:23S rRNA (guanosine2251-2'-O)-methyltransferase
MAVPTTLTSVEAASEKKAAGKKRKTIDNGAEEDAAEEVKDQAPAKKSKKGPTKGSGGKGRRYLEGKKGTLPAEQRHWYDGKQRSKAIRRAKDAEASGTAPRPSRTAEPERRRVDSDLLVGRNPVLEALRAGMPASRLFLSTSLDSDDRVNEAARLAGEQGVEVLEVTRAELDRRCDSNGQPGAVHQGMALQARPYRYLVPEDLLERALGADEPPLIVALDGVTDPHNLGACLRSADAAGVHAVVAPRDRAAGLNPVARKVASGAAESVPFAQVTNLARTLRWLQEQGVWVIGTAGDEGAEDLWDVDFTGPVALVLGAEGAGMRRLTREHCDRLVRIPMAGAVESLNVSVAAGVCLFEAVRQRLRKPT